MPKDAPRGEPEAEEVDDEPAAAPADPKRAKARESSARDAAGNGDWADLADKASRKVRELADKAMPRAKEAGESAKRMAVDVSEGLDGAFAKVSERARDLMAKGQHTRVR